MKKGLAYLLGGFLALTPLKSVLPQENPREIKKEVASILENCWDKEFMLTKETLEKEISKWPQNLADYMQNINYYKTKRVGNVIAFYMPISNSYFIPSLKLNSENFNETMGELQDTIHTKTDLAFLKGVNHYNLALWSTPPEDVLNLKKDLEAYVRDANNFLWYSNESVSHEMTHRLLHDSDGLASQEGFTKPSKEDFRDYVLHLMDSNTKEAIDEKFKLYTEFMNLDYHISLRYDDARDFFANIFKKTPEEISKYRTDYFQTKDYPLAQVSVNDYVFGIWKDKAEEKEIKFVEKLLSRKIHTSELEYIEHTQNSTYFILKEKPFYRLKLSKVEDKIIYELFYEPGTKELIERGLPLAKVPDFYHYMKDYQVFELMRGEMEASAINSLANVYFGPSTDHMWSIDFEGHEYFSKFKIEDEKIFQRFLEKNRIGREMLKEGYDLNSIRSELEFSESFFHSGTHYEWPASKVELEIK